ncbi:nod factor hydrolase protein 1-like [Curcuma longa]|uniref:nod factor hydrolase protein 1-like n=1 Tax=Curcuma longa TaxID=136217 RepID=UPI003D9E8302
MASSSIRAGYWRSSEFDSLPPCDIKFSVFTHLFYASLKVDPSSFELIVTDDDERMLPAFIAAAHGQSPGVKALISIGGDPSIFADLADDPANRKAFIVSTIGVAKKFGLDGFDLDWEFPNTKKEMDNFGLLVTDWRNSMGKVLTLTAAVWFKPKVGPKDKPLHQYPVTNMVKALNWINVMAYDLPGSDYSKATMLHAALHDPTGNGVSAEEGVVEWMTAGMPAAKIVLGMPLYARTWLLTDLKLHEVGAPTKGFGPGPTPPGELSYSKVVQFNRNNNAIAVHDEAWGEAYSYAGTTWLGYDDEWTVVRKVEYARSKKIAGYFFWPIDKDDAAWNVTTTASNAWMN